MNFLANTKNMLGLASTADEILILNQKLIDAVNAKKLASKLKDKDIPELQSKISVMNNEYSEKKNIKSVNETKITELKKQITGIETEINKSKTIIADVDNFFKEYTKLEEEKKKMEESLKKNTEISTPEIISKLEKNIESKKAQKIREDIELADKKQKDDIVRKQQFDKLKDKVSGFKMPSFSKSTPAAADGRRRRKSGSKNKSVKRRKSRSKRSDGRRRKSLPNKKSPKKKSKRSDGRRKRKSPSKKRSTKRRKSLY